MVNPNRFYTYAYLREDRTPYYIGKGQKMRIYNKNGKPCGVPKDKSRIIFLKQNLTEEEAFKHEIYMITVFGRKDLGTGILHNRTDGGEGKSGCRHNENTKKKISKAVSGKNHPLYGKTPSEETKRKMSIANKGRVISDEWRKNLSDSRKGRPGTYGFKGKKHSDETKQKLREINCGRTHSEETKKKLSLLTSGINHRQYGKPLLEKTKQKLKEINTGQNNPNYGKHWWNNGQISKLNVECPGDGWVRGRMIKKKVEEE
jgi:hypothetical protein